MKHVEVGETLGNSNTHMVRFNIAISKDRIVNKAMIPNYQKGDYERLRQLLKVVNWEKILKRYDSIDVGCF